MGSRRKQDSENSLKRHRMSPIGSGRGVSKRMYDMNKYEVITELHDKSQMQQTIYDALKQLNEWEYNSESVQAAKNLLRAEARKIGEEIENLKKKFVGGEWDIEKATETD